MAQISKLIDERIEELNYHARIAIETDDSEGHRIVRARRGELITMKMDLVYVCVDEEIEEFKMKRLTMTQISKLIDEKIKELDYYVNFAVQECDVKRYRVGCAERDELFDIKMRLLYLSQDERKVGS